MKKTITTITLAMVLTFTATIANAGILISDRDNSGKTDCTKEGILVSDSTGIIVYGREGIIVYGIAMALEGILISDRSKDAPCTTKEGILISDREGILISD